MKFIPLSQCQTAKLENRVIFSKSESGKYFSLGTYKKGAVYSGSIRVELDPENMYLKITSPT